MPSGKRLTSGTSATLDVNGQERVRPERARRGRVEKVWRSVRWAEAYPDESLTMNAVDLTPTFALRKLAVLFDGGKVMECAGLVRRLTAITLESILSQLPIDILHDGLPSSLPVLEAIYVKVAQSNPGHLPTDILRTDQLIQRLVALFAKHPLNHSGAGVSSYSSATGNENKNCNLHIPCCRSILRVIMDTEPNFRRTVAERKKTLDRCLRKMGQHGLVPGTDGKVLVSLPEALRLEFERQVGHFRTALHKLEQLNLTSNKHSNTEKPVSARPAPIEASHQRLMQVSRGDVQERVIKNKTLLNSVEPAVHNLTLSRLLRTLRSRVESDKLLLFHHTELRKMAASTSRARLTAMAESSSPSSDSKASSAQTQQMAMTLSQFSQGYTAILRLVEDVMEARGEVTSEDGEELAMSDDSSEEEGEGEGDYLSVTSTLSIMKKMKVVSLNGILPNAIQAAAFTTSAGRMKNGWLGPQQTMQGSRGQWKRDAGMQTTPTMEHGDLSRGVGTISPPPYHPGGKLQGRPNLPNFSPDANCQPLPNTGMHSARDANRTAMLEQEVLYLRQELSAARDQIRTLQEHEKQLRERLVGQAHHRFQMGNEQFEDVSLGSQRPTEFIRRYGDLYLDSRVEALDALDHLRPLQGLDVLKLKILFSVIVLSFKTTQQHVGELRGKLRHLLSLPVPSQEKQYNQQYASQTAGHNSKLNTVTDNHSPAAAATAQLEHQITTYLCRTAETFEVAEIVFEVCQQIYATLYDYPCLKVCSGLLEYVSQSVRTAWGLCVQRIPYTINYESQTFHEGFHARFHTSNPDSGEIRSYLWPALVDAQGVCVSRAVVIT